MLKVATGPVALGGFTLARDMGAEDVELLVHRGAIFWRKSFLHALDLLKITNGLIFQICRCFNIVTSIIFYLILILILTSIFLSSIGTSILDLRLSTENMF